MPRRFGTSVVAVAVFAACLIHSESGRADAAPRVAEVRVNAETDGIQQSAAVAMASGGGFVVAWQSEVGGRGDEIRARRFGVGGRPLGGEIAVNAVTRGNQDAPALAVDAEGGFVVVWQSLVVSHYVIRARRFDPRGIPRGDEFEIDTRPREAHGAPAVAMAPDGRFVVVWETPIQGSFEIRARVFDAQGNARGGELAVNTVTEHSQRSPAVALGLHGNFVVVWRSNILGSFEVRARLFSAAGVPQGDEFAVNEQTFGDQLAPAIGMDALGNFVVGWESLIGSELAIRARRFSAAGAPLASEFAVASSKAGDQLAPAVTMNRTGDFIVAWHRRLGAETEIRGRAFAADGNALGSELVFNSVTTGTRKSAAVALDGAGNFVVAWHTDSGGSWDVAATAGRLDFKPSP